MQIRLAVFIYTESKNNVTFIGANKVLSTYFVFTLIDDYVSWT